jgi:gluconate 2-dehydrogenase gamma chain
MREDFSGGAVEAGAPEFIDLLTSENPDYQLKLGGGLMWLDSTCTDRFGNAYLDCTAQQQTEMLDCIAYRKNAMKDASVSQGVEFFSFLRNLTADGFFTSKIGIQYLGYIGNGYLAEFPGCPPVPGV